MTDQDQAAGPVLILGASSAIAEAYARICAAEGRALVLAGRSRERLEAMAADLVVRGAAKAEIHVGDLADTQAIPEAWAAIEAAHGPLSEVLLAYGVLDDMDTLKAGGATLAEHLNTNFVSAALWIEAAAGAMERAGRGRIVVIGSVAGDRGRQSNYPYGAAKGGLERYLEGLQHRFALANRSSGARLSAHLVKPGFVDTPMTEGMAKGGPLWVGPEVIAHAMRRGVLAGRRVLYVPWFWRIIMMIIRAVPAFVLHRTKL